MPNEDESAEGAWLTTILRPAGALGTRELSRLSATLGALAESCDLVIVDLTAAEIRSPRSFAMSLRAPAGAFDGAGRCLLLAGAGAELTAALDRAAIPVVSLAADALPHPAA